MFPGILLSNRNNNETNLETTTIKKNYIDIERIIDELEEEQVMENILDIMEEKGEVKEINRFQSIKEVEKYLKQETYSKQLSHNEHNYANLRRPKPRSKIYNLREIGKFKKEITVSK